MWVDFLEELPESSLHAVSGRPTGLPGRARSGPVYKLPGGMIEQVHSVVPANRRGPACEEDVSID